MPIQRTDDTGQQFKFGAKTEEEEAAIFRKLTTIVVDEDGEPIHDPNKWYAKNESKQKQSNTGERG